MPSVGSMFKNIASVIESLTDNHQDPLHVGEAMACWTYLAYVSDVNGYIQAGLNTTTDPELQDLLYDGNKVTKSHQKEISDFMRKEGVPLPQLPEDKPHSKPNEIPLGAKLTDTELVNTVNYNFVIAADMCASAASQSLRTDVALMFLKFQTDKLSLGMKAKKIMQDKGWLKVPPFYHPPGSPSQS